MTGTAPREHDVELPTHRVRVLEWGPADGPLVVALHGFPDTAWTWRRVAPLLGDAGYRVAAPFLRGYAPSGIPRDRDYSARALAADATALHGLLNGDGDAALVGHHQHIARRLGHQDLAAVGPLHIDRRQVQRHLDRGRRRCRGGDPPR